MHKLDSKRYRKIRLLKFFKAFDDSPHHIAAVEQLQCEMPDELLNKFASFFAIIHLFLKLTRHS